MNRSLTLIAGVAAFALLSWWCVNHHLPLIENDLSTRSSAALADGGMPWALVSYVDGQRVGLAGVAPSEATRGDAELAVRAVVGVTGVDNQIQVRGSTRSATPAGPYSFSAADRGNDILLSGRVPDDGTRASVVGAARTLFKGRRVVDNLSVGGGAPNGWGAAIKIGLPHLAALESGELRLTGYTSALTGIAPDRASMRRIDGAFTAGQAEGFSGRAELTLPTATDQIIADCQAEFDRLLSSQLIRFRTGSAAIATDSFPLLDELALAAKNCETVAVEVQGHTDSHGATENNLKLSQRRARAVVDYLIAEGVAAEQLTAKGYGESEPIASNDTPAGRARNRRIEFDTGN